jgi:hypothetical protein
MPTPLDNLKYLRTLIAACSEALIDMECISHETACGTAACVLGTAAHDPYFNAQGLSCAAHSGSYVMFRGDLVDYCHTELEDLFGSDCAQLFEYYGNGPERNADGVTVEYREVRLVSDPSVVLTHKELALWRLDDYIARMEAGRHEVVDYRT